MCVDVWCSDRAMRVYINMFNVRDAYAKEIYSMVDGIINTNILLSINGF